MKIKKVITVFLIFSFLFCLSGCSGNVYTQADQRYIVSAIGFEKKNSAIHTIAEAIAVNAESTEQSVERVVLEGSGNTIDESLLDLGAKLSKPLLFDHCGVIIVDSSMGVPDLKEVFSYCEKNKQINLAAYIVYSENTKELLSLKPMAALTVGYDILGVISRVQSLYGVKFYNRFYELCANILKKGESFMLPNFEVVGEEYNLSGSAVYTSFYKEVNLSNKQTALYCLLTDTYSRGAFSDYEIASGKCYFDSSIKSGKLNINLKIKADIKKGDRAKLLEEIRKTANTLNDISSGDVFGFSNRIYRKNTKVWENIKENPQEFIKNASLNISLEDI